MTLSARISAAIVATLAGSADIGSLKQEISYGPQVSFDDGSGANQANKLFADTRTLAASANETLDLAGGLSDSFGNVLTFTKVRAILVKAAAANTNDVLVGGAASNGFVSPFGDATDIVKVKPGGFVLLVAPDLAAYAVTAGTGDGLKVANSAAGTGVTYDIVVIGS